jgi:hypothetical protein
MDFTAWMKDHILTPTGLTNAIHQWRFCKTLKIGSHEVSDAIPELYPDRARCQQRLYACDNSSYEPRLGGVLLPCDMVGEPTLSAKRPLFCISERDAGLGEQPNSHWLGKLDTLESIIIECKNTDFLVPNCLTSKLKTEDVMDEWKQELIQQRALVVNNRARSSGRPISESTDPKIAEAWALMSGGVASVSIVVPVVVDLAAEAEARVGLEALRGSIPFTQFYNQEQPRFPLTDMCKPGSYIIIKGAPADKSPVLGFISRARDLPGCRVYVGKVMEVTRAAYADGDDSAGGTLEAIAVKVWWWGHKEKSRTLWEPTYYNTAAAAAAHLGGRDPNSRGDISMSDQGFGMYGDQNLKVTEETILGSFDNWEQEIKYHTACPGRALPVGAVPVDSGAQRYLGKWKVVLGDAIPSAVATSARRQVLQGDRAAEEAAAAGTSPEGRMRSTHFATSDDLQGEEVEDEVEGTTYHNPGGGARGGGAGAPGPSGGARLGASGAPAPGGGARGGGAVGAIKRKRAALATETHMRKDARGPL